MKEPDLVLNDRELAMDLEEVKLEELHPDLEDMVLEAAACKFHLNM